MKRLYCRIPPPLKAYLTNLDIGLSSILIRWKIPDPYVGDRCKASPVIPDEWFDQIEDIAQRTGLTHNAVVVAALQLASQSTFNPRPDMPRDTPLNNGRPRRSAASPAQ